jgi:magnesium transporter
MKAFLADHAGVHTWDVSRLPPEGAIGWASFSRSEREHALHLLEQAQLGRRFQAFLLEDWRRPRGIVGARGVAVVFEAVDSSAEQLEERYLFVLLAERFLLTVAPEGDPVVSRLEDAPEVALADGLDYLVFQLASPLLDAYEAHSEHLVARAEELEQAVLRIERHLYDEIFLARREALRLRRVIEPELDVLNLLRDHRFPGAEQKESPYFEDLARRLARIAAEVESVRDGLGAMVESYASVIANELNRVMRFLTVLSTVFLPATLIASIYGMNFRIPEYHWPHGYTYSLALMAAVSGGLIAYMAAKGWFR